MAFGLRSKTDDRTRISSRFPYVITYITYNTQVDIAFAQVGETLDLPARGDGHEDHEEDEEAPTRTQQTHRRQHRHQARIG